MNRGSGDEEVITKKRPKHLLRVYDFRRKGKTVLGVRFRKMVKKRIFGKLDIVHSHQNRQEAHLDLQKNEFNKEDVSNLQESNFKISILEVCCYSWGFVLPGALQMMCSSNDPGLFSLYLLLFFCNCWTPKLVRFG